MRNDAAAKERRRQRARERQGVVESPPPVTEARYPTPDKAKEVLDLARFLGWTYERKKNGYLLKHPSGQTASLHLSLSDKAAWRNLRSQLLRPLRRDSTSD